MRIKNINTYELIMENLYFSLNEINKTLYSTLLEDNECICNEMCKDLKNSLIKSFKNLEPNLLNNQKEYIYENMRNIHNTFYNLEIKDIREKLSKLYESIDSGSKSIYMEFDYNDDLNYIYESYISLNQRIMNVNKELYRKEYMILTEQINENFINVYNKNMEYLSEGLIGKILEFLGKVKNGFGNKHEKILNRDKKWLSSNKKNLLNMDYSNIELEVVSDYGVTFEGLMQRHNIFDKNFINSNNKDKLPDLLRRFEDKKGNIKNGLDNYFRTGSSKKEIGLRKVSGDDAKTAVENMIEYCENFLAGKKFLDEKIDNITKTLSDLGVKEATDYSMIFGYGYNPYSVITLEASEDDFGVEFDEDNDGDIDSEENLDENEEKDNMNEVKENSRGIRDRQVGIAVLLTVTEERYFDYIKILKGLVE